MTSRERQISGGLSTALVDKPKEQATPFPILSAMLNQTRGEPEAFWDEVYSCTSSHMQKHLIDLARLQGLFHLCPLPTGRPQSNSLPTPETHRFQLLSQMLHGHTELLKPLVTSAVNFFDPDLDPFQREAVARALATPDICLIQGQAGTGKSRVAAEIITQAASQGKRILLLAQTAAAIDRILEMISGREAIYSLRCLEQNESIDHLPVNIRALTFAERSWILRQRTLESAKRSQAETSHRLQKHGQEKNLWPKMLELSGEQNNLQKELDLLHQTQARIPEEIERQVQQVLTKPTEKGECDNKGQGETGASPLFADQLLAHQEEYRQRQTRWQDTRQQLEEQKEKQSKELADLAGQIDVLKPLALARQKGRLWSPLWWRAKIKGITADQLTTLENQHRSCQEILEQTERQLVNLKAEEETARRELQAKIDRLRDEQIAAEQEQLNQQIRVVQEKSHALVRHLQELGQQLEQEDVRPRDWTPDAIRTCQERWQVLCAQEEEKAGFLKQWLDYVEEFSDTLAKRLPRLANVVAATIRGTQDDEQFGENRAEPFDLLLLDEAHLLSEPELFKVSRFAAKWVLIGEPAWETPMKEESPASNPGHRTNPGARVPAGKAGRFFHAASCFHRLWTGLHCDPSASGYDWYHQEGRLCCRLRPVGAQGRSYLETEAVADRPDIELRIFAPPREEPVLAEVLFPATTSLHEAKRYIFQELQEVALRTHARQLLWREEPERVVLQLAETVPTGAESVLLEEGVQECVAPCPAPPEKKGPPRQHTACVQFARASGWTVERARQWVESHLRWRDLGRTILLERSHRMSKPLAGILNEVLYQKGKAPLENGQLNPSSEGRASSGFYPPIEFVAITANSEKRERRRGEDRGRGISRGGHPTPNFNSGPGLEQDLSSARANELLPAELAQGFPAKGVINYPEAQAVVQRLEELVSDSRWHPAAKSFGKTPSCPVIAVIALYPAQVELIRRLIHKSPRLAQCPVSIEVGLPTAFRHRECLIALVSLTRSNGTRAVSYGETAESLPLALTRSRQKLILFGDPGTLARRSQWRGALDNADETSSALEKRWVDQLLKYLQAHQS